MARVSPFAPIPSGALVVQLNHVEDIRSGDPRRGWVWACIGVDEDVSIQPVFNTQLLVDP
jgi:hypothetical protein